MMTRFSAVLGLLVLGSTPSAQAQAKPQDDLIAILGGFLGKEFVNDWDGIEKLPSVRWAPNSPRALPNCLPDGSCYASQGTAVVAGRNLSVVATGARTIVTYLYLRNASAPFGEPAVLEALKRASFTPELARCPASGGTGGTNWYRLKSGAANPGVLSIQTSCGGRPCEGFTVSQGDELPALQPNQLNLYTEQCGVGADRRAVPVGKPHELLAETVVALLVPAGGPGLYDWKSLASVATGISWSGDAPKPASLAHLSDPSPLMLTGHGTFSGRKFSAMASGTPEQVKIVRLEELGQHPRGEHMLGVVYQKGITVQLVRCGPVYTESTNNWYSLTSARTRPAMIRQSIGYDGNQVQDAYELRLDGSLPQRDPRDRNPGVNGCR
jgi:hypothetical protein